MNEPQLHIGFLSAVIVLGCSSPNRIGAQLQGRTASPPSNSVDFQGRPISLPLKLCF